MVFESDRFGSGTEGMAETTLRPRQIEYYNPRPLVLTMCFFWGVVMGFCLFYFSPPKQLTQPEQAPVQTPVPQTPTKTVEDRRTEGVPTVTSITDEQLPQKPRFETMDFPLPPVPLTTEGGMTGRYAPPPAPLSSRPPVAPMPSVPADPLAPPIPELMP